MTLDVLAWLSPVTDLLKFMGTATTLLTLDGLRILVDPSFLHSGSRYHLGWGIFSTKLVDPVYDPSDLEVDLILLTHSHRDHWDEEATRLLSRDIPVITNPAAARFLTKQGFETVIPLDQGESTAWQDLTITALPAYHGPWFMRFFTGSVIGFGVTTSAYRLWISGDTIATQAVKEAVWDYSPQKVVVYFGSVRAYGIRITFDAKDALQVIEPLEELGQLIGVHVNDWSHFRSDPVQLVEAFASLGLQLPAHGEVIELVMS